MSTIQLLQISPEDLANVINKEIKSGLEELIKTHLNQPSGNKEFLTRKEASEFLGVSLVCLHSWCNKGILEPLKMGNKTYFEYSKLVNKLLQSNSSRKSH
jgi:hypothetical protein